MTDRQDPAPPSTARTPSSGRRMAWMLLGSLVVFGGLFAIKWSNTRSTNAMFDGMSMPPATISATEARLERWADTREAVGTLGAINGADVTTEAGGVVSAIHFEAGQPVRRGAILVELNTANELATLRALEAEARLAVTQRDRWQALLAQKLVSRDEADQRSAAAAAATARVEAQRALIAQKTIRAPFDGLLGIRRISLGQYVQPGDPLVSLQALDPILVDFTLPERQMAQVEAGTTVYAQVDALPGRRFEGRISAVEPGIDAATRNFTVQATIANPERLLRPGAFARVAFAPGQPRDVVVVPQTAISFNPYGNSVYVIEAARGGSGAQGAPQLQATQRFVKTGATRGDLVAVLEGLKPGERVATSGLLKLRNGAGVTIDNTVQPKADAAPAVENR